tara:strand:+ start:816 stop:995 length:180 start_codon:yes stop_codon:yes gene_type:complete
MKNKGKNWNSLEKMYTDIVSKDIQNNAKIAQYLRATGLTVRKIAYLMGKSISRIYEYLK